MRYHFIHVGLGKCMSTTLQNMWQRSSNTHFESGVPLVRLANDLVRKHRDNLSELPQFNLQGNPPTGEVQVLSAEGFSYSFLNDPGDANLVGPKQAHLADGLKDLSPNVLIMVRNPVAWIRSCHAQSIHQGGHQSAQEFIHIQRNIVLENLNLQRLIHIWRSRGVRVVVLPMELYIDSPSQFWFAYENQLGIPMPSDRDETDGRDRNRSHPDKLPLAAEINRIQQLLKEMVQQGDAPDRKMVMDGLELVRCWGARRALEKASDTDIDALSSRLKPIDKEAFLSFSLDADLLDVVRVSYVEPLRNFESMKPYIQSYMDSVRPV
jgi:hypothetical protein